MGYKFNAITGRLDIGGSTVDFTGVINYKGAYAAGTDYAVGDSVDYNGSSYVMFSDAVAGTVPTNTTYWQVVASKGDTGGGVPVGGTTGQHLSKINGTDYNTEWTTPPTQYTNADAILAIKGDVDWKATNWDTAYGWGNHASAGYLTSLSGAVLTDQTTPQTIGLTGARLAKLWATDLDVTNNITGSITGNAGTVTNATLTTALTVNTGTVTLTGNVANSSVLTIGAGAVGVSGSNTGDQTSLSGISDTMANFDTALSDGNFAYSGGAFHDGFSDFVANEHIDWTNASNNLVTTGSIGATGSRVLKGWFTDLEVTNAIAGSITGNAATVTNGVYTTGADSVYLTPGTAGTTYQPIVTWGDGLEINGATAAVDFNTTNLKITATELDTIQNIATTSSPTFAGLALGLGSITMTGSLGLTGSRLTKGWFTDLEVTNAIAGSITGNAATVTTNANLTGAITSVGNATSIASQTGTGNKFVVDTSPTLVTPALGAATYTTLSGGNITDSALTATRVTFAGTAGILQDSANMTFGSTYGLTLAAGSSSALQLSSTAGTAVGGLLFGTDTNLYRSAANTLKTDDAFVAASLTAAGLTLDFAQDIVLSQRANLTLAMQGQTSGVTTQFDIFTKDGDGTDYVSLNIFGVGTPTNTTNYEALSVLWDTSAYSLSVLKGNSGSYHSLKIANGGSTALEVATDQVLWVGSTKDTNLKRSAANTLATDDTFVAALDIYSVAYTDYVASSTFVGWSAFTTQQLRYKKIGKTVFVQYQLSGTSDSTTTTVTLPFTNNGGFTATNAQAYTENNGTTEAVGIAYISNGSNILNFRRNPGSVTYDAANGKSAWGQIFYETTQ